MRRVNDMRRRGPRALGSAMLAAVVLAAAPGAAQPPVPVFGTVAVVPPGSVGRAPRAERRSGYVWPRTSPEAQGLDSAVLAVYRARIARGEFGPVHSLLVVRHGVLVEEDYFGPWTASTLHPVYSVTKSVTALIYGIGLERGLFPPLDTRVMSLFPQYPVVRYPAATKRQITVEDLLTMRAGLAWNELAVSYLDPTNQLLLMVASPDWFKYVLDQPMQDDPGTRFRYSSGASVLLGGIIHNVTGVQPETFGREWLFAPLQIGDWQWSQARPPVSNTGFGLSLLPRDMAKIGLLVLHDGWWRGLPLVPADWLDEMRTPHVTLTENYGYGYQWWIMPLDPSLPASSPGNQVWLAWGYGGQYIFVVPALDSVVVSTAGCYDESCDGAIEFIQDLLAAAVVPAP